MADRRVGQLSRGNAVRLGLAAAIMTEPELLLLDESFASLDPQGQAELREILREERERGAAILVSSHQLDQLRRVSDEILVLQNGRITNTLGVEALRRPDTDERLERMILGESAEQGEAP